MTDFRVNVIVDPSRAERSTRRINRSLDRVERTGERVGRNLTRALSLAAIGAGIANILKLADSYTALQNRIRVVTNSQEELAAVTKELFKVSRQTRTGFKETSELYVRVALATRTLGLSQRDVINFTSRLNKALVLSGASAQEANAALIQLSQGLSKGILNGDELRSVLEQLPTVADVIAVKLKIFRGELRQAGAQGKITSAVIIEAFEEADVSLTKLFAKTIPTLSQGFQVLRNAITLSLGEFDKRLKVTETLSRLILALADNFDTFGKVILVVGAALAGPFAAVGLRLALRGVLLLNAAILANPIIAIVAGISAAVAALHLFGSQIDITTNGSATLGDLFGTIFDDGIESLKTLGTVISLVADDLLALAAPLLKLFEPISKKATEAFGDIEFSLGGLLTFTARILDGFVNLWLGAFNAIVAVFSNLPGIIGKFLTDTLNSQIKDIEAFINKSSTAINAVAAVLRLPFIETVDLGQITNTFEGDFSDLGGIASDAFLGGFKTDFEGSVTTFLAGLEKRAKARIKALAEFDLNKKPPKNEGDSAALKEQLRLLRKQAELLKLSSRERSIQKDFAKVEQKLLTSSEVLTASEAKRVLVLIRNNAALKEQADILDDLRTPQEDIIAGQTALNALYADGAISVAELQDQMLNLVIAQSQINIDAGQGTFIDGFIVGIEGMLDSVRNFSSLAGEEFASFFEGVSSGFSSAIADALVFGKDLNAGLQNAARQGLSQLLSGLIDLGIQYALNASTSKVLGAQAVAAGVAQASTLATAYATAAALASLASFGANAAPAAAGISSTVALSNGLALALADGGFVSGRGGPRSDSIPAMLSNGEFVVNAKSTARFRPQLEAMNSGNGGSAQSQSSPAGSQGSPAVSQPSGGTRIINVLDPSLVDDFISSPQGEQTIINVIERNSSSISQVLRNA